MLQLIHEKFDFKTENPEFGKNGGGGNRCCACGSCFEARFFRFRRNCGDSFDSAYKKRDDTDGAFKILCVRECAFYFVFLLQNFRIFEHGVFCLHGIFHSHLSDFRLVFSDCHGFGSDFSFHSVRENGILRIAE